jgi:hypothetical protein
MLWSGIDALTVTSAIVIDGCGPVTGWGPLGEPRRDPVDSVIVPVARLDDHGHRGFAVLNDSAWPKQRATGPLG